MGDPDAPGSMGDPDAFVPSSGCPELDADDASQIAVGRNSGGDTVIDEDTTWDAEHTYFVLGSLDVQGVTLTIEAGAHVCLDAGGGSPPTIDFREGPGGGQSRLVVSGTAAAPVVFEPAVDGSEWNSITLSSASTASLSHLTLIGGGAGGAGALRVDGNYAELFDARDVHLVGTAGMMLSLGNEGLAADASIYLDAQDPSVPDVAMDVTSRGVSTLDSDTIHFGSSLPAAARVVRMRDGDITEDTRIPGDLDVAFLFDDDVIVQRESSASPIPTLTIEAGAELRFEGTSIVVGSTSGLDDEGGNLVAVGTAERPIRLASASPTPAAGDWQGVLLVATAFEPEVTELAYVIVSDAGRDLGGPGAVLHCETLPTPVVGAIRLRGNGFEDYEGPRMSDVTIERSAGDGVAFACSASSCLVTDYASELTGTDVDGELVRDRACP